MATRPNQDRERGASGHPAGGDAVSVRTDADRGRTPSAEADEAVLRLARLVGRQIAREQVECRGARPRSRRKQDMP